MIELAPKYDPHALEDRWYKTWEEGGFFTAPDEPKSEKGTFVIVIPLPNVTGTLHMGHALNNTLQDVLTRRKRMQGYDTLWLPGTDHASIAVHTVIEKELAREGTTRFDMGREKFLEYAWAWKKKYGGIIYSQLKRLGASLDWTRTRFTLEPMMSRAVREAFVTYYEDGLIYRGTRIVNWCPRCNTAISDLEVVHETRDGKLWYIRYPGAEGGNGVVVATTRPETMLGDTAVAVHPGDERFGDLIGKEVVLPLTGRSIPVVADELVDPEFGTGVVKVTPAHDAADYDIGRKHKLDELVVMDKNARMNENAPAKYRGMTREECRKAVVEDLQLEGLLETTKAYELPAAICDRCKTDIEPYLSEQWWLSMKELAEPAVDVVKSGEVRFVPERWIKVYYNWMENVRDWCLSRQLWWGHRIPVWYCDGCGGVIVARENPTECPKCGGDLRQDEDVLDTWFSSALWPFGTMGWPDDTADLRNYFPGDVLVTAPDIIFLWVARMIFSALKLTGKKPFHTVYLHPMIQDVEGRRMSKSLGTGKDPLDIVDEKGADAVRYTMTMLCSQSQSFRLWEKRFEVGRNLTNKMWNAARFLLPYLEDLDDRSLPDEDERELVDSWILSRTEKARADVEAAYEGYRFNDVANTLYQFFWGEYCDWYLESIKPRLYDGGKAGAVAARTALYVFDRFLRLMHPIMPYITEELFSRLVPDGGYLIVAKWPEPAPELTDDEAEADVTLLFDIIRGVRNVRAEMNVPPGELVDAKVVVADAARAMMVEANLPTLFGLGRIKGMELVAVGERPAKSAVAVVGDATVYVPLEGVVDLEEEKTRLERIAEELKLNVAELEKKLSNEDFIGKAPKNVVARETERLEEMRARLKRTEENLDAFG
ncbi:MAG: valine--tRNA ligase [Candidatus Coatesbacteria bacterium]|nr:MAG: valine--tRNA ligase [Candidatus Coatesbacteria bacterium]